MYSTCDDLYDWVHSDKSNAEVFIKAVESIFRRNLVLIVDKQEQTLITCYSASKKRKRLKH